ncbi:MAG: MerR family transcriptional regulator [Elainella sp. Prado103]|jgi:DNA-binding transcriptional MerR regulator|nr:MerR family transcriptional regulator [Elainella sp. Prado103]
MRIGKFAMQAGVTPRTVRYYESLGLLGPNERQGAGFRYYTQAELVRLQQINNLKALGFSLEEIAHVAPLYFEAATHRSGAQKILDLLRQRLAATDQKIDTLMQLRIDLQANIDRIQQSLLQPAEQSPQEQLDLETNLQFKLQPLLYQPVHHPPENNQGQQ